MKPTVFILMASLLGLSQPMYSEELPETVDVPQLKAVQGKKEIASFEGAGNITTDVFDLEEGPATFKAHLDWDQPDDELDCEDARFTVLLLAEDRTMIEMVIGTIDHFDGARTIEIPDTALYRLNIVAPGKWTVRIEQ